MKRLFTSYMSLTLALVLCLGLTVNAFAGSDDSPETTPETSSSGVPTDPADPMYDSESPETDNTPDAWIVPSEESAEESSRSSSSKEKWTVMFYRAGEDSADEHGTSSSPCFWEKIAGTAPSDEVNVLLQTTSSHCEHRQQLGMTPADNTLQTYYYGKDGYSLVQEQPRASLADSETLASFISFCVKNYPADHYLLCFSGDGDGLSSLCSDSLYQESMPLDRFAQAVTGSGVRFDAVLMATSGTACLELCKKLSSCVHYLYAPQNDIHSSWIPYDELLQRLYDDPDCNGERLGKTLCNAVHSFCASKNSHKASQVTFSAIDLEETEDLLKAFDNLVEAMSGVLDNSSSTALLLRNLAEANGCYGMTDIYEMAEMAKNAGIRSKLCNAVENAVSDAILTSASSSESGDSHGISVFYHPSADSDTMNTYLRYFDESCYLAFLDALNVSWCAPDFLYKLHDRYPSVGPELNLDAEVVQENGKTSLLITEGQTALVNVSYLLMKYDASSDTWSRLGICGDLAMEESESGQYSFVPNFGKTWPTVDGVLLDMELVYENAQYSDYNVPVVITPDGEEMVMRIRFTRSDPDALSCSFADGQFETYGFCCSGCAGTASFDRHGTCNESDVYGSTLKAVLPRYTLGITYIDDKLSSTGMTASASMDIQLKTLPAGSYAYYFRTVDVFGRESYSGPVYFAIDDSRNVTSLSLKREIQFNSSIMTRAELNDKYGEDVVLHYLG